MCLLRPPQPGCEQALGSGAGSSKQQCGDATPRAWLRRHRSVRGLGAARSLLFSRPLGPRYCNATVPTVTSAVWSRLLATTELCAPHNRRLLRDDRRLAGRASLNGLSAVWRRGFGESAEGWTRSGPITSENAERCVAAGSGRQLRREGRGRTGDSREAFRRTQVPGRPARDIHRTPPAAQHYVERDGLKGAALRPAGGGLPW